LSRAAQGFHLLLTARWDPVLAMDILAHWLDLMNVDGWIPREQILGAEVAVWFERGRAAQRGYSPWPKDLAWRCSPQARSKVPAEFVVQRADLANPPTLLLPLQYLVRRSHDEPDAPELAAVQPFLQHIMPRLQVSTAGPMHSAHGTARLKRART